MVLPGVRRFALRKACHSVMDWLETFAMSEPTLGRNAIREFVTCCNTTETSFQALSGDEDGRDEVKQFVRLGPLPDSSADEAVIQAHETALAAITGPLTEEEAQALVVCWSCPSRCAASRSHPASPVGPDDCFGLAWTLLHLLETAPHHPLDSKPDGDTNPWLRTLWDRAH